ncbi:MAG: DUF1722 domain-containing protein [Candidatus Zixiibacteriota bacterium]|nr:MAG: DUF1722 domain-containing protein [candidate division Zixibacteria bacterium]
MKDEVDIRIGISSCLLGEKVRFDGGHKHDRFITEILGPFVTFTPVCAEVELGMGVPRESVRLVSDPHNPRMVGSRSGEDWTGRMTAFATDRVKRKNLDDISGFILKNRSPSCGMERVKVYIKPGTVQRKGTGLFAAALLKHFPDLPIDEEGRLSDPGLRENFIERVFAYHRLRQLYARPFMRKTLVDFHTHHKLLLLAHNPEYYRRLGRLVARIKEYSPVNFKAEYRSLFMQALKYRATVKKNTNVLQHITGFLRGHLSASEKGDIRQVIDDYHRSLVPLIVPITLLKHFVNKLNIEYIQNQYYLNPHPKELMLRNHV